MSPVALNQVETDLFAEDYATRAAIGERLAHGGLAVPQARLVSVHFLAHATGNQWSWLHMDGATAPDMAARRVAEWARLGMHVTFEVSA